MAAAAAAPAMSGGGGGSFKRRDHLAEMERKARALWDECKAYEAVAPENSTVGTKEEKFFCTFPYPYMNGRLHLGHAFTVTKAEFQARFQRLLGKDVLWPFAFHCTGMPIPACADKLKRELAQRSRGALTFKDTAASQDSAKSSEEPAESSGLKDFSKFAGKKSKAVAKSGGVKTQWEMLESMGVPAEEIPKFSDPLHWLMYFPPLAQADLARFGLAVDWRRSFITTDVNPYYDAFVRWQFNCLKKRNHVKFGLRSSVFSRRDNQPCADHDRASGEGVVPQEYTLIKMKAQELPPAWLERSPALRTKTVYLVAATLRPETMYGQTNCFVLPEGEYGLYLAFDVPEVVVDASNTSGGLLRVMSRECAHEKCGVVYVCSTRSALNMGYQGVVPMTLDVAVEAKEDPNSDAPRLPEPIALFSVTGRELIGLPLSAPNAIYPTVYALPMFGISMEKGTGVVTSVPSDSPDDFAALRDLQEKENLREQFGVKKEWCDFELVEVLEIPGLGRRAAVELCESKKIKSQKDTKLLAEAKEALYKRGFYEGIMVVGSQAGTKVCDAKAVVRDELILSGDALSYFEPERKVVSRSGDDCIVALCNQWYLDYGEEKWKRMVLRHVSDPTRFSAYSAVCLNQFQHVVAWLREWACSRNYGLGSLIPWEAAHGNRVLIESLSDSTIYMAYYTIAHLLQGDLRGSTTGSLGIEPHQMTDEVFDYIFAQNEEPPLPTNIAAEKLNRLRREFSYWYPLDLRVSGKDLIFNHLTMSLYNHIAMWPPARDDKNAEVEMGQQRWPQSFFCNGHVLVDAEKMSKSAGNFLTLEQSINDYTSDGTRIGLADAGDSLDDANFQRENANAALMRLYLLDEFITEVLANDGALRHTEEREWCDLAFENEIMGLAQSARSAYERLVYRDALKFAFFDFSTARDRYRQVCGPKGMLKSSVMAWIRTQLVILSPMAPHICEYIWTFKLRLPGLVINQRWPEGLVEDPTNTANTTTASNRFDINLSQQLECLMSSIEDFRKVKEKSSAAPKARKGASVPAVAAIKAAAAPLDSAVVYIARHYLPWQQVVLKVLQEIPLDAEGRAPIDPSFMTFVKNHPEISKMEKMPKDLMSFASFRIKEELPARGRSALDLELPFDELALIKRNEEYLKRTLGLTNVEYRFSPDDGPHSMDTTSKYASAMPSKPAIVFFSSVPSGTEEGVRS